MNVSNLIIKEIFHRKGNFFFSSLAVTVAVTFFVSFYTTGESSKRETTRLMRDIGYNIRIISKETNMDRFYANGYSDQSMPQDYVEKIANNKGLLFTHLLATLQKPMTLNGTDIILTGIAPEVSAIGKEKPSMIFTIKPGTAYVGFQVARSLNLKKNDTIEINGKSFTVHQCLSEMGSEDDIRVSLALEDAQQILGMEGKINEIQALNCYCVVPGKDPIDLLREQIAKIMPDTHMILKRSIAEAREKQRTMMENYFALIIPFVIVVCALWVGVMAYQNTIDRRQEIGILRALGFTSNKIMTLFLGKAIIIGIVGAVAGYFIGTFIALQFGPEIFKVTAKKVSPIVSLLGWSLLAAPLFTAAASFIPTTIAATQDPADTLRET
jgi:putative ABC transport system permease protein